MTLWALDFSHHQGAGMAGQRYATVDMRLVRAAGAVLVINRQCYGTKPDELAAEHNRRADDAGLPRQGYWYHLSRKSPTEMVDVAYSLMGGRRRMYADMEECAYNDGDEPVFPRYSEAYFEHVNTALLRADALTGLTAGMYSRAGWLDYWFTEEQQRRWRHRPGWWANRYIPLGWKGLARPYWLRQDVIGPWPGVVGNVDQDSLHPDLALAELLGISMLRLGPHYMMGGGRETLDWLALRPSAALFKDEFSFVHLAPEGVTVYGRIQDPDWVNLEMLDGGDMAALGLQAFEHVRPHLEAHPRVDVWLSPTNELNIDDPARMHNYAVMMYHFARLCHLAGKRAGVGQWAVGWPLRYAGGGDLWASWTPALDASREFGTVQTRHSYGTHNDYHALRHQYDRRRWAELGYWNVPLFVSESGSDRLYDVPGWVGGWKTQYGSFDRYWSEWVVPFMRVIEQDGVDAVLFTAGGGGGEQWADFDVAGTDIVDRLRAYTPAPALPEQEVPMTKDEYDALLARARNVAVSAQGVVDALVALVPNELAGKSNQFVLNLFWAAFGSWDELARVVPEWGTTMAGSLAARTAPYTGPAIAAMPLSEAEKAALVAALRS